MQTLSTPAKLAVRKIALQSISDEDLCRWQRLADRGCEPNPFLSPDFVMPLIQHLKVSAPVMMLAVTSARTDEWLAAGVFEIEALSRWWPLAYARSLSSHYIFLDGILLDRHEGTPAIVALFQSQSQRRDWHGLHFGAIRSNSELALFLDAAAFRIGIPAYRCRSWSRASFYNRAPQTFDDILSGCSKSRRKSLRRGRKRLEEAGEVKHRLVCPDSGSSAFVDTFLRLEGLGWKGAAGTALSCNSSDEAFFRQMIGGFARRNAVFFGELSVDGTPIASTCNLRCGDMLCAFKIGWDPAFAAAGIGMLAEVELAVAVSQELPEISRIDSSTKLGSYIESIWHDREPMISVTYSWSNRGAALQLARQCMKQFRSYTTERAAVVTDSSDIVDVSDVEQVLGKVDSANCGVR